MFLRADNSFMYMPCLYLEKESAVAQHKEQSNTTDMPRAMRLARHDTFPYRKSGAIKPDQKTGKINLWATTGIPLQ